MNFSFHSQFVDCPLNGFRRSLGRGAQFFPDQYLMHFSRTFIFLPFFSLPPTELTETQCIHRNAGTNRGDSVRLLADGVAGKLQRNCDANENFRFHQSKYNTSRKKIESLSLGGMFWAKLLAKRRATAPAAMETGKGRSSENYVSQSLSCEGLHFRGWNSSHLLKHGRTIAPE